MAFITTDITFKGQGNENFLDAGLIFKPMLEAPALSSLGFDIRTDIVTWKDMFKMAPNRKLTRKKIGCGFNPYGSLAELLDDRIEVNKLAIELEQCAEDFDGTILQTAKKLGVDRTDLTGTQLERVLSEMARNAAQHDMLRIMFLGDTASSDVDYNQTDGIFKKIFAAVADDEVERITAPAGALGADGGIAILNDLYYGASDEMQDIDDSQKRFYVTRSIYNNYKQSLTAERQLESSFTSLQNGVSTLTFMGVPIVPLGFLDQAIRTDFAGANPNRAIYAVPEDIVIGMDQESDYQTVDFWYEKKPQMNYMRIEYKLGVGLGWGQYIAAAY